ncbi:MAG: hypothetical protein COW00_08820 [Bdellovibrio sp. CG12_big_fil_rev_8_21_14_0_65_39_13]|nr:MAG: hypothetical protein COW78_08890 [Bdellovibrio sp. CG22_combo_CG10-13_8_21_14_all_39_27]PIQ59726.1 MAG: hypothetical protein COW00_08820 [Bdellovibrio sp. CG12_big_fil_rev_8_21_14_0_65_39_13]PIR36244.1 MAG: hypothetical protein COV37_04565 [Bdellovibrio sp. CG11_big_fil_rev_8_21_14_0_20_39_38]PJB54637.1 MAG: hypothetical protein CO099_00465 [Bdellovibrio sp. CG_4_9_14_3_um_filter_39_7]
MKNKKWNELQKKLSQEAPTRLRHNVFSKIENERDTSFLKMGTIAASLMTVAFISFWSWQKTSMPLIEEGVVESIEMQELLENQDLFAEVDTMELEEEDWQILIGATI